MAQTSNGVKGQATRFKGEYTHDEDEQSRNIADPNRVHTDMMFQAPRDIMHWRKGQVPRNARALDDNHAHIIAQVILPDQLRVPGDDITVHLFRPATSVAAEKIRQGTIECSPTPLWSSTAV